MIPMSFVTPRWIRRASVLVAALSFWACQEQKEKPFRGHRSVRSLDGMERFAARSVSIETAIEAMQERDLKKLKMLSVWVQKRDKTVLITPDDLSSLDLAIECLEEKLSQEERSAALDKIKSGKLKSAAREVCIEETD
jgi:superfamily II DNA or RNA helicase